MKVWIFDGAKFEEHDVPAQLVGAWEERARWLARIAVGLPALGVIAYGATEPPWVFTTVGQAVLAVGGVWYFYGVLWLYDRVKLHIGSRIERAGLLAYRRTGRWENAGVITPCADL